MVKDQTPSRAKFGLAQRRKLKINLDLLHGVQQDPKCLGDYLLPTRRCVLAVNCNHSFLMWNVGILNYCSQLP